ELDIIRWVCIHEVLVLKGHFLKVSVCEFPVGECLYIGGEITSIRNFLIAPEGHIEFALAVKPAQPVVARAVQIVEKSCGLRAIDAAVRQEMVEPSTVTIVEALRLPHVNGGDETMLQPT